MANEETTVVTSNTTNTENTTPVTTQEDNVIVSTTTSNTQVKVKDTAENVDTALDDVLNEGNTAETQSEEGGQQEQQKKEEAPKAEQTSEQQIANAHESIDAVEKDLTTKGVNFSDLEAEYMNNGTLSPESYQTLETAGYPKAVVDGVLAGWEAASARFVNDVYALAGGQEEFARIQQFVSAQSPDVVQAFNATLDTENLAQIRMTLEGLKGQMTRAYGTQRPSIIGGNAPALNVQGYETTADMVKDMSDPRYQTDPKYTREVYRKVKYSKLF